MNESKKMFALRAIANFEAHKCARTWDHMVSQVSAMTGGKKSDVESRLVKKYGKMFVGGIR